MRRTKCCLIRQPNGSMMLQGRLAHIPIRNLTVIPTHRTHTPNKILFLTNIPTSIPTSREASIPISKATTSPKEVHKVTLNTPPGKIPTSTIIQVNTADGQLGISG